MIFTNEIESIKFFVLGEDEIKKNSAVEVKNKILFKDNAPKYQGIYDLHMGTTDNKFICSTCRNQRQLCNGHFGHITLPYPIISPVFRKEILKWLRIICQHCGHIVINTKTIPSTIKSDEILSLYAKLIKTSNKTIFCVNCDNPHHIIHKDKKNAFKFYYTNEEAEDVRLYNTDVEDIVNKISDESVLLMGKSLDSHPKKMVLRNIVVPHVGLRPDIKKMNSSRSNNNDTTTILKNIIGLLENCPNVLTKENIKEQEHKLEAIELHYYSLIKDVPAGNAVHLQSSNGSTLTSLLSRHTGKTGRIRNNMMGKRVPHMGRSVVSGDNNIAIDEVGVPIIIARNMQIPETVRSYNIDKMMIYFNNKDTQYPGCTKIVKNKTGKEYYITANNDKLILEEGDILYRDLIDGDKVALNRAPSLLFSSISGHKVKVIEKGNTLRLSVNVVDTLYGGDFDGDAMNIIFPHSVKSRNECSTLTDLKRWFISYKDASPAIGVYHDGLIGMFELTKNNINITKLTAMQMFSQVINIHKVDFSSLDNINNSRDLISLLLPNISYGKLASHYNEDYTDYVNYDKNEINVLINRGKIISGRLDKRIVGQNVDGSIFHVIHNKYGAEFTLNLIYNLQQLTTFYLMHNGYTINYDDIVINKNAIEAVTNTTNDLMYESELITEKLKNNQYIPPINMTLEDYYEQLQISALNLGDAFLKPILENINPENNNLYKLISSGTKGKLLNLTQISSAIGQTSLGGKRMPLNFSFGRSLPYFERFSTNPLSRGFVSESYSDGVTSVSYISQAREARFSITNKALSTAKTGYQNRKSIKNLESLIVDNLRKLAKPKRIVQYIYGEDGVDIRYTEKVKFHGMLKSIKDFKKEYKCEVTMLDSKFRNKTIQSMLDVEYEQLLKDREEFRSIFLTIEQRNNKSQLISDSHRLPINFQRIIDNVVYDQKEYIEDAIASKTLVINPIETIKQINNLCERLMYYHFNEIQYNKKMNIPEYIKISFTLLFISLRENLCMRNIINKKIDLAILENIKMIVFETFNNALIEPGLMMGIITAQSISEPSTQYILDSQHRSGAQGTDVDFLVRSKEIFGAKPTDKMMAPKMTIFLKEKYQEDKIEIQKIANHIEMLSLKLFVVSYQLFFEHYKEIVHPDYVHETKMLELYEKHNPNLKIPNDLIKFCIRLELSKEKIIEKNISLEIICFKIQEIYPFLFLVNTSENADTIILRLYIRNSFIKKTIDSEIQQLKKFIDLKLLETIIRGDDGIISTYINKVARSYVNEDESIAIKNIFTIGTTGTNLDTLFENEYIDPYMTYSNSIIEMQEILGIEAAREMILNEIRGMIPGVDNKHYQTYADVMCEVGYVTPIEKKGIELRSPEDVLLLASNSHPVQVIEKAAINSVKASVKDSLSSGLMVGQVTPSGSLYNKIIYNEEFIEEN